MARHRRNDRLLLRLFLATLVILAVMHPAGTGAIAHATATAVLAVVNGVAQAAAAAPTAALLAAGGLYLLHHVRTHRPAHAHH